MRFLAVKAVVGSCILAGLLSAQASARVYVQPLDAAVELSTRTVRTDESNLAGVIVDALRSSSNTDAALMASSSFEEMTIKKGPTTSDEILKSVTFQDDQVYVVKLTGDQVRRALEHALALYPQRSSYFLQLSGISVTVDAKAEKDHRVESLKIGGSAAQPSKTYTIAMPAPLADGALAYHTIWQKSSIDKSRPARTVRDAVTSYLNGRRTVGDQAETRITFKK